MSELFQSFVQNWVSDSLKFGGLFVLTLLLRWLEKKYPTWKTNLKDFVTMFAFLVIIWFGLTGQGVIQPAHTMPENVDDSVRRWSDTFGLSVQKLPASDDVYFIYKINLPLNNRTIIVSRPKQPGRYLQFSADLLVNQSSVAIMNQLSAEENNQIDHEVSFELAKARVGFATAGEDGKSAPMRAILLRKSVPIGDALTEYAFISTINEMDSSMMIADEAVAISVQHHQIKQHPVSSP